MRNEMRGSNIGVLRGESKEAWERQGMRRGERERERERGEEEQPEIDLAFSFNPTRNFKSLITKLIIII